MNSLSQYITEKLHINKDIKVGQEYKYHPKDKDELKSLLEELLEERGKDADLNDIDTSNITDMKGLFIKLDPHNIDISNWDVSNVTNMSYMFYECENFNSDLSSWDISNVINIEWMFYRCKHFNCDLSKWNVNKVKNMTWVFRGTYLKNIPSWYHE